MDLPLHTQQCWLQVEHIFLGKNFQQQKQPKKTCWLFLNQYFLILRLMDWFFTHPELKINLTFLKLHFEGNESVKRTESQCQLGKGGKHKQNHARSPLTVCAFFIC